MAGDMPVSIELAGALDATAVLETLVTPADPVIALSSNCTVKDATALQTQLLKLVGLDTQVSLDVRSVERVDTATMQLLCAFVRQRAACNAAVKWIGNPPALAEAARMLGVQSILSLPAAGAA